jgi:hypothetical protein
MIGAEPLWRRGVRNRYKAKLAKANRGAAARLALADLLKRCGHNVGVATIHTWSRELQGRAYLWGIDFLGGREDVPPPWEGP